MFNLRGIIFSQKTFIITPASYPGPSQGIMGRTKFLVVGAQRHKGRIYLMIPCEGPGYKAAITQEMGYVSLFKKLHVLRSR